MSSVVGDVSAGRAASVTPVLVVRAARGLTVVDNVGAVPGLWLYKRHIVVDLEVILIIHYFTGKPQFVSREWDFHCTFNVVIQEGNDP